MGFVAPGEFWMERHRERHGDSPRTWTTGGPLVSPGSIGEGIGKDRVVGRLVEVFNSLYGNGESHLGIALDVNFDQARIYLNEVERLGRRRSPDGKIGNLVLKEKGYRSLVYFIELRLYDDNYDLYGRMAES